MAGRFCLLQEPLAQKWNVHSEICLDKAIALAIAIQYETRNLAPGSEAHL
jgi:hypothetical protein